MGKVIRPDNEPYWEAQADLIPEGTVFPFHTSGRMGERPNVLMVRLTLSQARAWCDYFIKVVQELGEAQIKQQPAETTPGFVPPVRVEHFSLVPTGSDATGFKFELTGLQKVILRQRGITPESLARLLERELSEMLRGR